MTSERRRIDPLPTGALPRRARAFAWLEDARRDLRYAVRALARTPGFTGLALLTLGLGIGSVTVIYSVIHNVLLDPLPYPGSERFVNVVVDDVATRQSRGVLSVPEFLAYRDQSSAFEEVVGTWGEGMLLATQGRTDPVRAVWVTPNFFQFMGLPPLLGRAIAPEDGRPGAPAVAVLRHRAWIGLFGADPTIIGQTMHLNGEPRTIVGVMPPRFTWHAADVWIPGPLDGTAPEMPRNFQARLKPGATREQADAQLATIAARRAPHHPQDYPANYRVRVVNVIDAVVGNFRAVLYSLLAAVGLLMLIACCNVANMLLARAMVREREMTIRAAMGAGRGRIVRQLLVESVLLALAGAVLGCMLAFGGIKALVPQLPQGPLPGEIEIALDGPALLFSLGTAVLSALLFGIAPALYSARRDLVDGLRSAGKGVSGSQGRVRGTLVVAEIALSLVLLLSAGLLMRSFLSLARVDLGFDAANVLSLRPVFSPGAYATVTERRQLYQRWFERIASLPGVKAVGATSGYPLFGGASAPISIPGMANAERRTAMVQWCTDDYLETLGVPLLRGRGLTQDAAEVPRPVALVNRAFVKAYFGGAEPLGRHVSVTMPGRPSGAASDGAGDGAVPAVFEIVGVVEDVRNQGIRQPPAPEMYLPGMRAGSTPVVLVRTAIDAESVVKSIREELRALDRQVALRQTTLAETLYSTSYAQPRFSLIVLGVFAVAGMLLVAIGVYSVMAYAVSRQTQEIAVRMALGARRLQVCRTILTRAAVLVAAGVGLGLLSSVATSRLVADQLWNTSPHDPVTIGAAITLVMVVALIACLVPIRRALRVQPMIALRRD